MFFFRHSEPTSIILLVQPYRYHNSKINPPIPAKMPKRSKNRSISKRNMTEKLLCGCLVMLAPLLVSGHTQHSIQSWRLKTSERALRNSDCDFPKWDIYALEFYGGAGCEPSSKIPLGAMGTAIAPVVDNADEGHDASKVFDENDSTFYRGLMNDSSDSFWIGLHFHESVISSENIGCIRLLQRHTNFAIEGYIQEYDGVKWINRQNVMLGTGWSQISVSGEITESELSLKDSIIKRGEESFFKESDSVGQSKPRQSGRILTTTNVAVAGTATQSSDEIRCTASRAIDGDINGGVSSQESMTHTQIESVPWWKAVLDDVYAIQNITVYNRSDCCNKDIIDFILIIYNGNTEVYNSGSDGSVDTSKKRATYAFQFSPALDGDTVLISLPRNDKRLFLTEVVINAPAMVSDELSRSASSEPSRISSVESSMSHSSEPVSRVGVLTFESKLIVS